MGSAENGLMLLEAGVKPIFLPGSVSKKSPKAPSPRSPATHTKDNTRTTHSVV
ncbi:hypothetical protein AAMO2058_000556600 [Amorphochlora amoebiformis]